jgi:hypothetical protein
MPLARSELTIPAFERPKTVHALDRVATAISKNEVLLSNNLCLTSPLQAIAKRLLYRDLK